MSAAATYQIARSATTTVVMGAPISSATSPDPRFSSAFALGRRWRAERADAILIGMTLAQALPHPVGDRQEFRRLANVERRSRGKLHSMTSWMRPGRGDMTTMRVDRNTASGIEWVTNSTVLPVTSHRRSNCWFSMSRTISSSAPNGSSISRRSGSNDRARAIEARCCMPPDNCQGYFVAEAGQIDELEALGDARVALRLAEAHDLERQRDVARDAAPRIERRRLEHVAIGAVGARFARAQAVDADRRRRSASRDRRSRAEASSCRSPTGR